MNLFSCLFVLFLGFQDAAGTRIVDAGGELEMGNPTTSGRTWMCQDVQQMGKSSDHDSQNWVKERNLTHEYDKLTVDLHKSTAWHGGYKGEELTQKMFFNGHEEAFEKKGVRLSMFKSKNRLLYSEWRLCMSEAGKGLPWEMMVKLPSSFKRYDEGNNVQITCGGEIKRMVDGVVAQSAGDGTELPDPQSMRFALLKLLTKKTGAMQVQEQFKRDLASGPKKANSAWATLVTKAYKDKFAGVGLQVLYNTKHSECCCGGKCTQMCSHTHRWFEYVDLEIEPAYFSREVRPFNYDPDLSSSTACSRTPEVYELMQYEGIRNAC